MIEKIEKREVMDNKLFITMFGKMVEGKKYMRLKSYPKEELFMMELFIGILFLGMSYEDAGLGVNKKQKESWEKIITLIESLKNKKNVEQDIKKIIENNSEISQAYTIFKYEIIKPSSSV